MGKNDDIIAINPDNVEDAFRQNDWIYSIVMGLADATDSVDDAVDEIDIISCVIHNTLELYTWQDDDKYRKSKILDAVLDDIKAALTDMSHILDDLYKLSQ